MRNVVALLAVAAICSALPLTSPAASASSASGPQLIAFGRGLTDGGKYDIWVVRPSGTGLRRITRSPGWDWEPAWSPNGHTIAFTRVTLRGSDLYVVNANGTGLRRLAASPTADAWPSWSPNGTRIAFTRGRDAAAEIYVMNANGAGLRRLTSNHVEDGAPAWSPDGRTLAFTSQGGTAGSLARRFARRRECPLACSLRRSRLVTGRAQPCMRPARHGSEGGDRRHLGRRRQRQGPAPAHA